MRTHVLLFASVKDAIGASSVDVELPDGVTVGQARERLIELYPSAARPLSSAIAAVNREFADLNHPVNSGDELAFFPPVSGGAPYAELAFLAPEPYSTDALIDAVATPDTGAVCVFTGKVRGQTASAGGFIETLALEYEAYEAMAVAKMRQVIDEIRARWPGVQGIAVVQRVGRLSIGDNTIAIVCASAHRDSGCFEAARYGIDRLKEIVPVWKQEIQAQGGHWVEGLYHPGTEDRA